jgi:hypothetical protein
MINVLIYNNENDNFTNTKLTEFSLTAVVLYVSNELGYEFSAHDKGSEISNNTIHIIMKDGPEFIFIKQETINEN